MIVFDKVSFHYDPKQIILEDICLKITPDECLGIIGSNGVGKTTLIKLMNGLLKPNSGNVYVDDLNTKNEKVSALSKKVGLIFQNPEHMIFSESVFHEISFGLKNLGIKGDEIATKVEEILEKFNLTEYSKKSPFKLSGGQKKMLSIACADALNPKYLILDEPTIGQDAKQRDKISNLINDYRKNKKSVIIITHDLDWLSEIASRIIILSENRILTDGSPENILTNKEILKMGGLMLPQIPSIADSINSITATFQKKIINLEKLQEELLILLSES